MQKYFSLIKRVLKENNLTTNRTNTKTYNSFGGQVEFDLKKGFPLLTTKEVNFHAIIIELLWFIKGDTNIQYLIKNKTNIWNEWAYEKYIKLTKDNITQSEFVEKIKEDNAFAIKYGNLGPIYGKQWRNFGGIDQLSEAITTIKNNPESRRIIVSSWNPPEIQDMSLPPCHCFFQLSVINKKLNLHLYQRSADLFLGVPFNFASYALLLTMISQVTNLEVGKFVHSFGDLHIYENHFAQCELMLKRKPYKLPKIWLNPKITKIEDFSIEDIQLKEYKHHPKIIGQVAV